MSRPKFNALELRKQIIDVMSKNGGHLASNLGSVEMTLALHQTFDLPKDRLLFDVSHQTYAHKLLTDRPVPFSTIRKYKGLSGFADPTESPHDHFYAGHAGTALSLALGLAKARDLDGGEEYIIAVVSDAALTCGLTYEALNNMDPQLKRFIVILNDNAMSISDNVGAITRILRQGASQFFEQFGLTYKGPIDGHDLNATRAAFEEVKQHEEGPTLIHLHTIKGHGMESAVESPTTYHGVIPFDITTGKFLPVQTSGPTFPKIFGKHMVRLAEKWPELVAITPAMPAGSSLTEMMARFPDRCLDVGIAEGHAVTFAGGLAKYHARKVVVAIYSTFLQRAFDNLFHDVCLQGVSVVFCLDRAGIAGGDGITHNGIYDIGFLNSMPNIVICQPRDGHLLKELLESSFSYQQPTVIRYPNLPTEAPEVSPVYRPLGQGEVLQKGSEWLFIALGHKVKTAFAVSELLATEGIRPTIVDPIFLKPLDTSLLLPLLMTHRFVVVIEEHSIQSGLSSLIAELIAKHELSVHPFFFAVPDQFLLHGDHKNLTKEVGLDAETITRALFSHLSVNYVHSYLST